MQAQVDSGGDAGRGEDLPFIDEEHVAVYPDARVAAGKLISGGPVRGGPAAVKEVGRRQRERAGADGGDARTTVVGRPQCAGDLG